jgi:hypothetical protein
MRRFPLISTLMLGGLLAIGLTACAEKGPAEKAGEQIDQAASEVQAAAAKAADEVEAAASEVKDRIEDRK